MKTGEYTLPGFRHDWAAMNLSLFAGSPFFKTYGAGTCPPWLRIRAGGPPLLLLPRRPMGRGLDRGGRNPGRLPRAVAEGRTDVPGLDRRFRGRGSASLRPPRVRDENPCACIFHVQNTARQGLGGHAGHGPLPDLLPRAWLEETFEHPHIRALRAWGMHLDFAPDVAGGAMFPYLEGMAGQGLRHGPRQGRGGYHRQGPDRRHLRARREGGDRHPRRPHPA